MHSICFPFISNCTPSFSSTNFSFLPSFLSHTHTQKNHIMLLKGCQETPQGSNYGRLYGSQRLRHLLPRPSSSITNNFAPCCINSNKFFSMNHQQTDHVQSRKEEKHMEHIVSSRWNPTPEQLMALEEMYRRGVRTPSAEEIKLIAAKLKQFGKIEAKNVFYWFQNHKARERQKRRRQPEPSASDKFGTDHEALEGNDKGFGSKDLKAQENNKLISSLKDPHVSMQRPMVTEDGEMQHMKNQRKMSKASDTFINATNSSGNQEMQTMMLSTLNFSIFSPSSSHNAVNNKEDGATRDHQITLELFPLEKDGEDERDFEVHRDNMNPTSVVPPNQFYEFL